MKKTILYGSWIFLYILCAGLAHVTGAEGLQSAALLLLSVLFFIPGAILLADALRTGDRKTAVLLRWLSGGSLALTVIALAANVASALASETVGNVLYEVLIFVSVPMVCSQQWLLSLFLWACLFCGTFLGRKKA